MNKQRFPTCLILFLLFAVFSCACVLFVLVGGYDDLMSRFEYLRREPDIRAAQEEMSDLVQTVITHNQDTLLQEWEASPIYLITAAINHGCIRGATELIYQSSKTLSETANHYSSLFNVEAIQRMINGEEWFIVEISEKRELILLPITKIPPWLPSNRPSYPNECLSANACYKISVGFSYPSTASCSG